MRHGRHGKSAKNREGTRNVCERERKNNKNVRYIETGKRGMKRKRKRWGVELRTRKTVTQKIGQNERNSKTRRENAKKFQRRRRDQKCKHK